MFTWTVALTLAALAVAVLVFGYSLGGLAYGWLALAAVLIALWFLLRRREPTDR